LFFPMYLPMSPFHILTAGPISTKFCTDLPTNWGKVLNTRMTTPTRPPDPGVPQTPKPKWITGEKTLCSIKCPDGWRKFVKFFLGSAGARLASVLIKLSQRLQSPLQNQRLQDFILSLTKHFLPLFYAVNVIKLV